MDKSYEKEEEYEIFEFLANGQMTFEPGLGQEVSGYKFGEEPNS